MSAIIKSNDDDLLRSDNLKEKKEDKFNHL